MIYSGKISDVDKVKSFMNRAFQEFKEKEIVIDIDLWKDKRSLQQNKYLHLIFGIIGKELGYSTDDCKYHVLTELNFTREIVNKKTGKISIVPRSTSELSYNDFYDLTSRVSMLAGELGIRVMTPQEYFET
jgi:hypothetical protein